MNKTIPNVHYLAKHIARYESGNKDSITRIMSHVNCTFPQALKLIEKFESTEMGQDAIALYSNPNTTEQDAKAFHDKYKGEIY